MILSTLTHFSNQRQVRIFLRKAPQSTEFPTVQNPRHRPLPLRDKGSTGDLSWFRQPEKIVLEEKNSTEEGIVKGLTCSGLGQRPSQISF